MARQNTQQMMRVRLTLGQLTRNAAAANSAMNTATRPKPKVSSLLACPFLEGAWLCVCWLLSMVVRLPSPLMAAEPLPTCWWVLCTRLPLPLMVPTLSF